MELNRRAFVTGTVAGAAALCTSGVALAEDAEQEWDYKADMVVVGGGGTGYAAAIEALDAGCTVLVLEKSGVPGGNTLRSAGMMLGYYPDLAKRLAPWYEGEDSLEKFEHEMLSWGGPFVDQDKVIEMCETSEEEIRWVESLGRKFDVCDVLPPVYNFEDPDAWAPRSFAVFEQMEGHFQLLQAKAQSYDGLTELVETEAKHLIQDDEGQVIGVEAVNGDRTIRCKAARGVLIATAGPDFGDDLTKFSNHQQFWGSQMCAQGYALPYGTMSNTGDGIRMGLEIGAALNQSTACVMTDRYGFGQVGVYSDVYPYDNLYHNPVRDGAIYVNAKGNRFVQEDAQWAWICSEIYKSVEGSGEGALMAAPNVFAITDEEHVSNFNNMTSNWTVDDGLADGTVLKAGTLAELAEMCGIASGDALEQTVQRFNSYCERGEDLEFHRIDGLSPIAEEGPYYAMRSVPLVMGAAGGLAMSIDTEVLDLAGNPIPRLYVGGMASGGWIGQFYNACGWAVLGTVHWGRKAGRAIAALDIWE